MSFVSRYATNKVAETAGTWVDFGDDIQVKVARINNKEAKELRRKLEKPYRAFSQVPDDVSEDILVKVVAGAVVKDWKGIVDADGEEIPFSAENAVKLFKDFPDFFGDVVTAAVSKETFAAQQADDVKNA